MSLLAGQKPTQADFDAILADIATLEAKRPFLKVHTFGSGIGTKTITGVGFKPRAIIVLARERSSATESTHALGYAVDNGVGIDQGAQSSYGASASHRTDESQSAAFIANTTSVQFAAAVTSFDNDGITVNVSIGNGTVQYNTFHILFIP